MILNKLHRLRNSDPDESGTDTLEDFIEPDEEQDIDPENPDAEAEQEEAGEPEQETADDELVVTLGDEQPDEEEKAAPNWVKDLRKQKREDAKRIRELEERLAAGNQPKSDDPGKEPELEDFDYDADQFKAAFKEWTTKKAKAEQQKELIRKQQEEAQKEWQSVQETYAKGKSRFPKEKMVEAEEEVVSILPGPRQAMLMDMADDSAALVVALGSNPEVLRKLASIKSDAKFVKELAKVEMKMEIKTKSKTPPPPERTITGSGRTPGASASSLNALYEKAQKTGDYTAYYAAKNKAKGQ